MPRVLVVGYGNPSRRDDGVGHHVVQGVRDRAVEGVSTVALHQLEPELVETLKDYDLVIFVDANADQTAEGLKITPVEAAYRPSAFTHLMSPSWLLALTRALYHRGPKAFIVGVPGYDFDFGTELSDRTSRWVPDAIERILEMSRERS